MNLRKSERLLNLLIMLLVQRTYVPKDRIRAILYPGSSTDAFEKMFERDKEELRSLGVPIEVGSIDPYFDDDPGYRIRPDEFALPDISLTADEAAVIGLATRVWEHARLAEATTEAVRKLTALGVPIDVSALDIAESRLSADEPSFDVFWEATQERTPVEFDYRRSGATSTTKRHLQPWGVVRYSGRWYVVGLDTDRREERVFRLSRVRGEARKAGEPGSYDVPPGTDVRATAVRLAPPPTTGRAVLLVRDGAGLALRRDAESVEPGVAGPDDRTAWDRVVISRGGIGVSDELLGYGADVYVEEPAELRTVVVDRLRAAVGGRLVTTAASQQAGAKDQVARLLTLVPFLHARGQVRLDDAAKALGVPQDQLLKDLKVLLMCGLPGGYPDDLIDVDLDALEGPEADGVIRVTNADYLARPLRLTPTEATAIIVALRALRNGARDETREVVDRALTKLETAAAEGSAVPQIDPGEDPAGTDLTLLAARLQTAVERGVQVDITYFVPSRDEESERTVDPRGIVTANGFTYLDAWCHSAEAPRLFRLDRIRSADVSESPVVTPPEAPRDLADGLFARADDTTPVTLRLQPQARWIVEYYPVEAVRPRRGGILEVDLLVADERWLQRLLLRLAPHAEVLKPAAYATAHTHAAQAALTLYE